MRFEELSLDSRLLASIALRGYTETTDVQARTLAATLRGRDAAVQSQTGTGKTAAFLITIFDRLINDPSGRSGRTLIVAPTRELAIQIEGEAKLLNRGLGFVVGCFTGGVGYDGQRALLKRGVDIIIGTPGRLLDLADKGVLRLRDIRILVIDEADRLFDMGFMPELRRILRALPPPPSRQSMLFSATLNRLARQIAVQHMNETEFIELTPDEVTVEAIDQVLYRVPSQSKADLLLGLFHELKPRNALIFTNTKHYAERLAGKFERSGLHVRALTGDLPQNLRMKVMDDFHAGRFPYLIATDIAARGLHIEGLEMVVNFDLPLDIENYVHRIGRTGRAGRTGKAVSLACEIYGDKLAAIERFIGRPIPVQKATADLIAQGMSLEFSAPSRAAESGGSRGKGQGRPSRPWRPAPHSA
ncbi:MAG: DEAD/DEAH box helicase [Candidatus Aminicenantes bacterium]|nr:DEAD/DEAH box helicase [Candidatus Aminicenantes bacterium]